MTRSLGRLGGLMMSSLISGFRPNSIAVILAGGVIACSASPTQPSWDGQVRVTGSIRDFPTDAAINGARVTIGNTRATTDANGTYSLAVPAGDQHISVDGESVADVAMKDRTYRGDFYVHLTGCVARYGTVIDKQTRQTVSGANLFFAGSRVPVVTDQTGWFRFSLGCPGTLCIGFNTSFVTITQPDYRDGLGVLGRGVCRVERADYELDPNMRN
jgi:hypothetical protein